ncbi:uncharacterized protein LOC142337939 [Convolutriloba macropyga]|uniref:uncharacterized protein LOC142337939 n=1 Tax=Convolutriloba macropyga TaxID=536237 RepID=UPI003F51F929
MVEVSSAGGSTVFGPSSEEERQMAHEELFSRQCFATVSCDSNDEGSILFMYNNRKDLTNGDYNYLVYCVVFCCECLGGVIVLSMAIERYFLICKANDAKTKLNSSNRKKMYFVIIVGFLLTLGSMLTDVAVHHTKFENIRKCSLCWFQRFYIAVALFFHCVVPTIVFSGYIYKLTWRELLKEVDSGQSGLQERKKTLAKAFGLISVAFSLFYSPYVVASAVNIYYISRHSSVFNDSNANRSALESAVYLILNWNPDDHLLP